MRRSLPKALLAAVVVALLASASAYALKSEIDGTKVSATATIFPRDLPARGGAPVSISSVTRIGTTDGTQPEKLTQLSFSFDKHGFIQAKGLPVCTLAKLADTTTKVARKRCPGAIVGEGTGKAEVRLPGQAPVDVSTPLTFFNAPPQGGLPSLIAHARETVPVAKTLLVPIAVKRIHKGRYGFQATVQLPEIAGGYGAATLAEATIGKTWKRGGKTVGFTNAYCAGGRLQVYGKMTFADGSFFPGTLTSPCHLAG